jgi:F420H(2)-dependent quinone reductase
MTADHAPDRPEPAATRRPARLAWVARLTRLANPAMRLALRLPFATPLSERLMLLTIRGRRTGRTYRQPVSFVRDGDTLLTPGGGKWKLNLRADAPVRARLRGREVLLWPELIGDADTAAPLLAWMSAGSAAVRRIVPVIGPDGAVDRARLDAALRYGFRVVRWHVAPPVVGAAQGRAE